MADTPEDFTVDCEKWVKDAKGKADQFKTAFPLALVDALKEKTPVVTGRMRAGWHVEEVDADHATIVNDAEYAHRVNSGFVGKDSLGREYDQRGRHMVEQVIAEAPEIAKRTLEDIQ